MARYAIVPLKVCKACNIEKEDKFALIKADAEANEFVFKIVKGLGVDKHGQRDDRRIEPTTQGNKKHEDRKGLKF